MGFLKVLLPCAMVTSSMCLAQNEDFEPGYATETEAKARDFDALQEYIKTKRAITVKEKGGNMMISGDIRGEYYKLHCVTDHKYQRGWRSRELFPNSEYKEKIRSDTKKMHAAKKKFHTGTPAERKQAHTDYNNAKRSRHDTRNKILAPEATNEFNVQANLTFDYIGERGWGTIRLQMTNPCGIPETNRRTYMDDSPNILYGSGKLNDFVLRKCFAGYNVYEQGSSRFDVEIGRRRFFDVFDSKIEFGSWFDGVLARYTNSFDGVGDLSVKAGAFVIDYTVNHYGYVGEIGLLNIADAGFDVKYSLIDWDFHRPNRYGKKHALGNRYVNSQLIGYYHIPPDLLGMPAAVYAAGLINHAAPKTGWTHHLRANKAAYVGAQIGEALRKNDWAAEIYYMWVQAQSISERDVGPASRDNPRKVSFENRKWGGGANYRGYRAEAFYVLTDNWTLNIHWDKIREMQHRIGGKHRSTELYLAAIFAF